MKRMPRRRSRRSILKKRSGRSPGSAPNTMRTPRNINASSITSLMGSANFIAALTVSVVGWVSLNGLAAALGYRALDPASLCMARGRGVAGVPLFGHPDPHDAKSRRSPYPAPGTPQSGAVTILSEQEAAKVGRPARGASAGQPAPPRSGRRTGRSDVPTSGRSIGHRRNQRNAIRVRPRVAQSRRRLDEFNALARTFFVPGFDRANPFPRLRQVEFVG